MTSWLTRHEFFTPIIDVARGSRRESVGDDFTPKTSKMIHPMRRATATLQQPPEDLPKSCSLTPSEYTEGNEYGRYQQVKSSQTWFSHGKHAP